MYQQRFTGYILPNMFLSCQCILLQGFRNYLGYTGWHLMLKFWMDSTGHRLITAGLVTANKLCMNSLGSNYDCFYKRANVCHLIVILGIP